MRAQEVDWTKPTAFLLGNEKVGVSEAALALADQCVVIPMAGFVESFNISVAAALIMYEAHQQRVKKLGRNGDLSEEQQKILQAALMLRSVVSGQVPVNLVFIFLRFIRSPKSPGCHLLPTRRKKVPP